MSGVQESDIAGENRCRRGGLRGVLFAFSLSLLLCLSSCSLFRPGKVKYIRYPVKRGDTLGKIASRFDVSIDHLQRVNALRHARDLQAGVYIRVPYHGQSLAKRAGDGWVGGSSGSRAGLGRVKPDARIHLTEAEYYLGRLHWPCAVKTVNSKFGRRWFSFHEGIDVAAPTGTSIYAAHDGIVAYSGNGISGYGNLVIVRGEHGLMTVYAHNRRNLARKGQRVRRGSKIAEVGATGKATGPHLHFETRIRDESGRFVAVDPLAFY